MAVRGGRTGESDSARSSNWGDERPKCGAAASRMWALVAEGEFNADTLEFLQTVAIEMVAANAKKQSIRRAAIIRATGLEGASDVDYALRNLSEVLGAFGASAEAVLQEARREGVVRGDQVDTKMLPKIRLLMRQSMVVGKVGADEIS